MSTANFGFAAKLRLKTPAEYQRVFANPVKSSDQYFTVLAMRNGLDHPRLGLAIAKKQIKKATARNRIKRIVRENFRLQQAKIMPIDIVVLARTQAAAVSTETLSHALKQHWFKLARRCGFCSSP